MAIVKKQKVLRNRRCDIGGHEGSDFPTASCLAEIHERPRINGEEETKLTFVVGRRIALAASALRRRMRCSVRRNHSPWHAYLQPCRRHDDIDVQVNAKYQLLQKHPVPKQASTKYLCVSIWRRSAISEVILQLQLLLARPVDLMPCHRFGQSCKLSW